MPPSYQPLSTRLMATACSTATVGPQPTVENVLTMPNTTNAAIRATLARMPRILEHSYLNPAERLFFLERPSQVCQEVGAAQPEDTRPRASVGWCKPRPVLVAAGGDREPVRRFETERAAVLQHRFLQCLNDLGPIGLIGILEDRIVNRRRRGGGIGAGGCDGAGRAARPGVRARL